MKEDDGLSLRDFFNVLYRRIFLLKITILILPAAVLLACFIVDPVYETSGKILVTAKKENAALLQTARDQGTTNILNLNVDETDLNSEMALLTSLDLWMKTVNKLGLASFKKRQPGIIHEEWEKLKKMVRDSLGLESRAFKDQPSKESTEVQEIAKRLIKDFKVVPALKSKIIDVSFKYSDPVMAQKILDKLLELYIPYHLEAYGLPGAEGFYAGQGDFYREKYEAADKELADFKNKWGIAYAERQKAELIATIKQIEDSLVELNANQSQYDNMLSSLKNDVVPTGQLAPSLQRGNENAFISVIATQLLRAKQKQLQVAELFAPESRDYIAAEEMVKDLNKKFQSAIQVEIDVLKAKKASLEQSLKEKQEQLQQFEEKSEESRRLQLSVTIAKERYLQFVSKEEEARLATQEGRNKLVTVSIVGRPVLPVDPIFPMTGLFVLGAFVLSFPIGIAVIFVANFLDSTFDSPGEVESATGCKVLATLGQLSKAQSARS
ncbi:MAG TPA: Wzz/FepE/Etk N-terminal domain-containing protein [Desulfomonilaceae bacterium]|nr:Wzz/FepE/Etk N-terminal domain-containing protein [Desulfomonilaceae bacterium]